MAIIVDLVPDPLGAVLYVLRIFTQSVEVFRDILLEPPVELLPPGSLLAAPVSACMCHRVHSMEEACTSHSPTVIIIFLL